MGPVAENTFQRVTIEAFRESWGFTRGLTRSFIEATPADAWDFRPHDRYGTMARQFRHVVQVTDLYTNLLRSGHLDMDAKFARYDGSLDRSDLLVGMTRADDELAAVLSSPDLYTGQSFDFGGEQMSLGVVLDVFIEHEANHHGLWSAYAALGGWETPEAWRDSWDL